MILKSPDNDITNKIELICPTNAYSNITPIDIKKPLLILYTRGKYFEPIYQFTRNNKNKYLVKKFFNINRMDDITIGLKNSMTKIWESMIKYCKPRPTNAIYKNEFEFISNISATRLENELEKLQIPKLNIKYQLVNLNTKVVALLISINHEKYYIPTEPSNINTNLKYKFLNESYKWSNYSNTLSILNSLWKKSNGNIPVKPARKVINNGIIVGILTQTNQMVPVFPEKHTKSLDGKEDLKILNINNIGDNENFLDLDQMLLENKTIDQDRVNEVARIKMESNFYNVFRNLLRILLKNPINKLNKSFIKETIESPIITYVVKIKKIKEKLHEIMDSHINFVKYKLKIKDIVQCFNLNQDKCVQNSFCSFSPATGNCILQIPKYNKINPDIENSDLYFTQLSDELIRYVRIREYLFYPRSFLSFPRNTL